MDLQNFTRDCLIEKLSETGNQGPVVFSSGIIKCPSGHGCAVVGMAERDPLTALGVVKSAICIRSGIVCPDQAVTDVAFRHCLMDIEPSEGLRVDFWCRMCGRGVKAQCHWDMIETMKVICGVDPEVATSIDGQYYLQPMPSIKPSRKREIEVWSALGTVVRASHRKKPKGASEYFPLRRQDHSLDQVIHLCGDTPQVLTWI